MAAPGTLKVLMLASSYPRSEDDSASVFLRYLADGLAARGLRVHVLAPADVEGGTTVENGIRITRFRYLPRRWRHLAYGSGMLPNLRRAPLLWLAVPFYLAAMLIATLRCIRRWRPDVLHAHWILPQGLVAAMAGPLTGTPIVTTSHGSDAFGLRHPLARRLKAFALRRAHRWTANTRATARAVGTDRPPDRIIPMGVDVARFEGGQRQRLRAELGDARHLLLHVGRLVANKGTDDLIRAFAALDVTLRNETRLWIVGSGDREAGLRALSRELGVSDGVRFWGSVANARLPDFYAAADLLLAPSVVSESGESEGQSVVILEAFAARLPVLATDVGGIGEAVQHGTTGWLVPPRQPYLLARAIGQLLSDGELRTFLARNAASAVAERYDWTVIAAQFEDLYRTLRVSDASRLRRRVAKSTGRECP